MLVRAARACRTCSNDLMRKLLAILLCSVGLGSCSPQSFLSVMPGVFNDPANRTLRRELLAFGTDSLCKELLARSIPLKLNVDDPTLGRFFPRQCNVETLETTGDLYVQFGGSGYGWTNLTKRVGFNASAAVQYEQDFKLDGSTMYVYFRPAAVTAKKFEQVMVEGGALPSGPVGSFLPGGSAQGFVNQVGEGMLLYALGQGFTVIRESDGEVTFSLGVVPVGERPLAPFDPSSGDRDLAMNERIEIHQNQRDYAGPIDVPDSGMAVYVTALVEGARDVDVMIYPRATGDVWIQQYLSAPAPAPAPAGALMSETITDVTFGVPSTGPLAPAQPYRRRIPLPKGSYYVVLDNTNSAGNTAPASAALDDRAALVSLGIEVGSD